MCDKCCTVECIDQIITVFIQTGTVVGIARTGTNVIVKIWNIKQENEEEWKKKEK